MGQLNLAVKRLRQPVFFLILDLKTLTLFNTQFPFLVDQHAHVLAETFDLTVGFVDGLDVEM